jgi:Peptidase family M48
MFDLINNLRSELLRLPPQPVPASLNERAQVVKQVVNHLYKSVVPENQTEIAVSPCPSLHFGSFATLGKEIQFSALLFLASEEIPERFRFNGPDDSRLNDQQLVKDYFNWICEKLEIPAPIRSWDGESAEKHYHENHYNAELIRSNLQFLQDPENAKKAIKFILLHELGHVHHNDIMIEQIVLILINTVSVSWPICVAIALSWSFAFSIPFVLTAALVSNWGFKIINQFSLYRDHERRADAFAANSDFNAIDGGIYLFKTVLNQNKEKREKRRVELETGNLSPILKSLFLCLNELPFSPEGNHKQDFKHPALTSRISALESAKQLHTTNSHLALART